jgi:dTDP-4-amino-4,6-dideoxygalactose transaminase
VFADIRPDTLNVDENLLAALVTERTRAIVLVHYAGVACEMDPILKIARGRDIAVVEDNAHGLFGKYRGRWLGTFGDMAAQSFHETKNITSGEGGALLLNTDRLLGRAEIIRQKGTDRARFFRGEVDKYSWVDVGSSYVMSDVLAAFLYGQLEVWPAIQRKRQEVWGYYRESLSALAGRHGLGLPSIPEHCEQAYHMFYLITRNLEQRTALIDHLRRKGILAVFHYTPLHLSAMGQRFGGCAGQCPVAEDLSERLLRLPFFNAITRAEQDRVIGEIIGFYEGATARSVAAEPGRGHRP